MERKPMSEEMTPESGTAVSEARTPVMTEFRKRHRIQLTLAAVFVAVLIGFSVISGRSSDDALAWVMLPLIAAVLIVSLLNWRCPACNRYLGKTMFPKFCGKCGARLR